MVVNALYILATGLGAAFLLGVLHERQKNLAYMITLAALSFMGMVSAGWLVIFIATGAHPIDILTAGTQPPFAINLRMGLLESALMLVINLVGLLTAMHMGDVLLEKGRRAMAILLVAIMALCGIVLTRDIFNLFVFFELIAISTGGLILLSDSEDALAAGFKYMIVSQFISILLLIGILFAYHATGTLNIDGMAEAVKAGLPPEATTAFALAFFLILIAVVAELKPFPANGWALDIYQAAHPGYAAVFSAATGTAMLFAVDKVLAIGGADWLPMATGIGIITFVASNLLALPQTHDRRLLGYSSIAQTGLILTVIGQQDILGERYLFIAGGLLLAHAVAKAGLFWLSDFVAQRQLTAWSALRERPLLVFAFVSFIAMLSGLPPFPSFYAKWELLHRLAAEDRLALLALILFGALIEAGYLFRWFGYLIKRESPASESGSVNQIIPVAIAVLAGWGLAFVWGQMAASTFGRTNLLLALPLLFALAFLLLEWLPAWLKNTVAIAGLVAYFVLTWAQHDPLRLIFATIFLIGGAITLLASYHAHGRRVGFYPAAMVMFAGLVMLIEARVSFDFFAAWELLTVGSYFLILRGKESEPHALSYIVFSLGGAFLILAAFAIATGAVPPAPTFAIARLADLPQQLAPWIFVLLALGFMTKTAAIGLHIWLPGAHAEAETDVSPMVSGILLKAGLYGLVVLLLTMGKQQIGGVELTHVLLWIDESPWLADGADVRDQPLHLQSHALPCRRGRGQAHRHA
jgi:formate hydrogenlyase subunit 3/multisubunit Na+/H+ antiporter MnhD subunit